MTDTSVPNNREFTTNRLVHVRGHQTTLWWFIGGTRDNPLLKTDGGTRRSDDAETDDSDHNEELTDLDLSLSPNLKKFIRYQHSNECDLCGADGDDEDVTLAIHHRRERRDGGSNHPENLMVLCRSCHQRHHNNTPIEQRQPITTTSAIETTMSTDTNSDDTESPCPDTVEPNDSEAADESAAAVGDGTDNEAQPLPPHTEPNEADKAILDLLEEHGSLSTGELAALTDYSAQYVRRQCWKLGGEQLIVPRANKTWDLIERTTDDSMRLGLPEDPKDAQRAGRDEVIRKMSAHGMTHTKIAEITGLARGTIDVAVNRARALRIDSPSEEAVDIATIATRLSALLELIDHRQMETV